MLKFNYKSVFRVSFLVLFSICSVVNAADDNSTNNNSTVAPVTTQAPPPPPKIIVADSDLCKKCTCSLRKGEISELDCSGLKKGHIFDQTEWNILQNGDVIFDTIRLDHNNITSVPAFPSYGVKNLYLSNNQISEISKAAFQNLTKLEKLDLSHNQLTSKALQPDVFQGPYVPNDYLPLPVKELDLGYNSLHNLDSDLFEHLSHVETLILCMNSFTLMDTSSMAAIGSLRNLKTLDISYMELRELHEALLHGPDHVENLILSGNLFEELPDVLTKVRGLYRLNLDENPIKKMEGEEIFENLATLSYLSLSYMPDLERIGPYAFSSLKNLSTLVLVGNSRLKYIDRLAFASNTTNPDILDYPPITELYLHNNNLTSIDQNMLVRWDKVETIDLRFNPWTCDCSNHWLIRSLMLEINLTKPAFTHEVTCNIPEALHGKSLLDINAEKILDDCVGDEHPETHSLILVGLLVGVLIGIPITLASLILYRRGCFGLRNKGRGGDRALYNRAEFSDDFHI